jgi:type IV pilus assembly protein PilB
MAVNNKVGELLLAEKLVDEKALFAVLESCKKTGTRFVDALVSQSLVDENTLITVLSKSFRMTIMDLSSFQIDDTLTKLVPKNVCQKHLILPVGKRGNTLVIATSDPTNIQAIDQIRFQTRMRVEQVLTPPSTIRAILDQHFAGDIESLADSILSDAEQAVAVETNEDELTAEGHTEQDAPIIQFVSSVLLDAVRKKASDIHIEPYEGELRIRVRLDGDLMATVKPPNTIKAALVARIKVLAKMRLDEKRLPQDGRIRYRTPEGKLVDFRVNTLPTVYGEKVVLRILDRSAAVVDMSQLGFEKDDQKKFMEAIAKPWGMVLVAGATGSGKTTTLYGAINYLNKPDVNISTIEDPVEYNFKGINQTQTKEAIGLTFSETLRALLRQDPDIILLGEIRDKDTAEIAFKAALTGHLVLSTLHTNDAPSSVMRLKDMGIDTFLVNAALHLVVAQRLIRRICEKCKEPDTRYNLDNLRKMGFPDSVLGKFQPMRGRGCPHCRQTGYKGRVAIHELMVMTETLRDFIGTGAATQDIRKMAIKEGMKTLKINAMRKVVTGVTSIDELSAAD